MGGNLPFYAPFGDSIYASDIIVQIQRPRYGMAPRGEETVSSYEVPQPAADVHDYYRNFADAIDGKAEQIVTHAQMRRVMEVIEAAFRSAASGQVVYF